MGCVSDSGTPRSRDRPHRGVQTQNSKCPYATGSKPTSTTGTLQQRPQTEIPSHT